MYDEVMEILSYINEPEDLIRLYSKLESFSLDDKNLEERLFKRTRNELDKILKSSEKLNLLELHSKLEKRFKATSSSLYHLSDLIMKNRYNCLGHSMIFLYLIEKAGLDDHIRFGYLPYAVATGIEAHILPLVIDERGETYYIDYAGVRPVEIYELLWGVKPIVLSKKDFISIVIDDYITTISKNTENKDIIEDVIRLREYSMDNFITKSPRFMIKQVGDSLKVGNTESARKYVYDIIDVYFDAPFNIDGYKYFYSITSFVKDEEIKLEVIRYATQMSLLRYGHSADWITLAMIAAGKHRNREINETIFQITDSLSPRVKNIVTFYLDNNNAKELEEKILLDMIERVDTYELLRDFKRKKQRETLEFLHEFRKNREIYADK